MRRSAFTLVEVLLALGVVVIGICSIMVLFPVGANATRDASMETYAVNSVEELLSGIRYKMSISDSEWKTYVVDSDSIVELGTTSEAENNFSGEKDDFDLAKSSDWDKVNINIKSGFFKYKGAGHVYQLVSYRGSSESLDEENVDFRAIARLAKSKVKIGGVEIGYDKAVCIHVEVSWPAEAPFEARQVAYYSMDVFKKDN